MTPDPFFAFFDFFFDFGGAITMPSYFLLLAVWVVIRFL